MPARNVVASLALIAQATARLALDSQQNVAVYWGQNSINQATGTTAQQRLSYYCANTDIDVIPLAFINQITKGPGDEPVVNFANQGNGCQVFSGTSLFDCPSIGEDITTCQQQYGKTILISLGGATYTEGGFDTSAQAIAMADHLWELFGPVSAGTPTSSVSSTTVLTSTTTSAALTSSITTISTTLISTTSTTTSVSSTLSTTTSLNSSTTDMASTTAFTTTYSTPVIDSTSTDTCTDSLPTFRPFNKTPLNTTAPLISFNGTTLSNSTSLSNTTILSNSTTPSNSMTPSNITTPLDSTTPSDGTPSSNSAILSNVIINNGVISNSTISNSVITNSTINSSTFINSTITGSTFINSTIIEHTIIDSIFSKRQAITLRPFGAASVDGFDLDFESPIKNIIPFAQRLRTIMDSDSSKRNYLTAAPQCVYPDANVGDALASAVSFDAIFVQFYNNNCGVQSFVPDAATQTNFNFANWDNWAKTVSANKDVKVLVGVPAGPSAAGSGYLSATALAPVLNYCKGFSSFGGVMMWDASQAYANIGFLAGVKSSLVSGVAKLKIRGASWH